MRLDTLSPAQGSRKDRKRVGRGDGSNKGSFSGRGCKGQKSRSGHRMKPGFEGGQLPIIKRLPSQRGFTNIFKTEYALVNLSDLADFAAGSTITIQELAKAGIVKSSQKPLKVLGGGEIKQALTIKAHKFSASARAKIEAAGGKAEEVGDAPEAD
jgi:large subunit ribosomal protein L15